MITKASLTSAASFISVTRDQAPAVVKYTPFSEASVWPLSKTLEAEVSTPSIVCSPDKVKLDPEYRLA